MCGIIGYTGNTDSREILLKGLDKLEYRGYDSAGMAIFNGDISIIKTEGSIAELEIKTNGNIYGNTGIAHTRWATHGPPNELNSHPHLSASGNLVMVHNGIIENSEQIKSDFGDNFGTLKSETDSEILLNLIDYYYSNNGGVLLDALQQSFKVCVGSYALVLMERSQPGKLTVCKKGSPIVIASNEMGAFVASDIYALSEYDDVFYFPEDGDIVFLDSEGIRSSYNKEGIKKKLSGTRYKIDVEESELGSFSHFMEKEVSEQPRIASKIIGEGFKFHSESFNKSEIETIFKNIKRVTILGCGTSWHAGLIGRYMMEKFARVPVNTEYASEYRYRNPVIDSEDLVISISQSGETADTIAANRLAREAGAVTMGLINVSNSTLVRETDLQLYLKAGQEVGVASTKAYTSQLIVLIQLTAYLCEIRNLSNVSQSLKAELMKLPDLISGVLASKDSIEKVAYKYSSYNNFLFLGRGINYPSALEGALKLKEISYIHAEGYPGAEMKHGPIALIDYSFPTLAIVTDNGNREKMISNLREIKARNGRIIVCCKEDDLESQSIADDYITVKEMPDILSPIVTAIPLQLFSYYIAVMRGCNVDRPRNLAKSVTVE